MAVPIGVLQKSAFNIPFLFTTRKNIIPGSSGELLRVTPPIGKRVVLTELYVNSTTITDTESGISVYKNSTKIINGASGFLAIGKSVTSVNTISVGTNGHVSQINLDYGEDLVIEKDSGNTVRTIAYSYYISE